MTRPMSPDDLVPTDVPIIESTEPVYSSPDATNSEFVTCRLYFDAERNVFWNFAASKSWILDDHGMPDATYAVNDTTYTDLDAAIVAALADTQHWPDAIPSDLPPEHATRYRKNLPSVKFSYRTND